MFIYIATIGTLTKIGVTSMPGTRMRNPGYKEGRQVTLAVLHDVGDNAHAIERESGRRFALHRRHGRYCKRGRDWYLVPVWQMRMELERLVEQVRMRTE